MGNFNDRVVDGLSKINGPLYGEGLLEALKASMIKENVFQALFGLLGERIFIDEIPSYNDSIIPLIEFWWKAETYQSRNSFFTGSLDGRILLPAQIDRKKALPNYSRRIGNAFQRFLGGDNHNLFDVVPGLIEFGFGMNFRYDQIFQITGLTLPAIAMTIPAKFDLRLLQLQRPEVDWVSELDADEIGFVETYRITIADENSHVLIPEGVLSDNR